MKSCYDGAARLRHTDLPKRLNMGSNNNINVSINNFDKDKWSNKSSYEKSIAGSFREVTTSMARQVNNIPRIVMPASLSNSPSGSMISQQERTAIGPLMFTKQRGTIGKTPGHSPNHIHNQSHIQFKTNFNVSSTTTPTNSAIHGQAAYQEPKYQSGIHKNSYK